MRLAQKLSHMLYHEKQSRALAKEHLHQVPSLKIRAFPFIASALQ